MCQIDDRPCGAPDDRRRSPEGRDQRPDVTPHHGHEPRLGGISGPMPADRWPAACDQSNSLRIEADHRPAKPRSGSRQEQRAIAQSGKIARAGGGHPCEQTRGRLRPAPGDGRAAHRTQEGLPGRIDGGSSEPVLAMLVGDGGEAPHQRAIAHRLGQTGQIGRDRVGVGRQCAPPPGTTARRQSNRSHRAAPSQRQAAAGLQHPRRTAMRWPIPPAAGSGRRPASSPVSQPSPARNPSDSAGLP
jgi:hypothetical protein